jgi:hypothetical protein
MYHVTFGSPPVGTADFATYFNSQLGCHQSWSISHEQDLIPQCFTWCASKRCLKRLNWWSDWCCVGEQRFITKMTSREPLITTKKKVNIGIFEKCKMVLAGLGSLVALCLGSLLAVPASTVCYLLRLRYYKGKRDLQANQENLEYSYRHGKLPAPRSNVGLEHHSLQTYIDLIQNEDDLKTSIDGGPSESARNGSE